MCRPRDVSFALVGKPAVMSYLPTNLGKKIASSSTIARVSKPGGRQRDPKREGKNRRQEATTWSSSGTGPNRYAMRVKVGFCPHHTHTTVSLPHSGRRVTVTRARANAAQELGKGSFGTVYLTEGRRDKKAYVVKVHPALLMPRRNHRRHSFAPHFCVNVESIAYPCVHDGASLATLTWFPLCTSGCR
jgi:hypothetical protein